MPPREPSFDIVVLPKEFFLADFPRRRLHRRRRLRLGRRRRPSRLYRRPRRQLRGLRSRGLGLLLEYRRHLRLSRLVASHLLLHCDGRIILLATSPLSAASFP